MRLEKKDEDALAGKQGHAAQKSMEILLALGNIYGADKLIPVSSVQVAGVSYHNLGDAGLEFLDEMARDGKAVVTTTLNPAGMDLRDWKKLGISSEFAEKQLRIIRAYAKMGIQTTCTCTPYLIGNKPNFGEHIAWSESSAVCYANSILGARTNREGGPSALAAALIGKTPNYGLHLEKNRQAQVLVEVQTPLTNVPDFGALGYAIGKKIKNKIPLIRGVKKASLEQLKSFCASIATFGGTALFHIEKITPNKTTTPKEKIEITREDIAEAYAALNDSEKPDFVSIGCPHCSLAELKRIAELVRGKKVKKEFWICVARAVKEKADVLGYSKTIEASGAKFACDTCMAVAPLKGRFRCMAIDSAKGCYYARGNNNFKTNFKTLEECVREALSD
ncbi:MAG: aconitase X catalytic domain-containing protein [Candidatus Micrarchaeota archaeon]